MLWNGGAGTFGRVWVDTFGENHHGELKTSKGTQREVVWNKNELGKFRELNQSTGWKKVSTSTGSPLGQVSWDLRFVPVD